MLKVELGAELLSGEAGADLFGGNTILAAARQWMQPNWHEAPAEQIIALSDPARPELGALALIRLVRLPASVDQALFDQHILPEMLAYYGETGRVGDSLSWIGNAMARTAAAEDAAVLDACGNLEVASVPEVGTAIDGLWSRGGRGCSGHRKPRQRVQTLWHRGPGLVPARSADHRAVELGCSGRSRRGSGDQVLSPAQRREPDRLRPPGRAVFPAGRPWATG